MTSRQETPSDDLYRFQIGFCNNVNKKLDRFRETRGIYKQSRHMRPLYLYMNRVFERLEQIPFYTRFLRACYTKSNEFTSTTIEKMDFLARNDPDERKRHRYMRLFVKNMQLFRQTCIRSDCAQYSKLPGYLPLDLRSIVVSYIACAPMKINQL
jgi:hypothetical protein